MIRLAFFICVICCISCKQKKQLKQPESKKISGPQKDKIDPTVKKIDSIFHNALEKALILAKTNNKGSFKKTFSIAPQHLNNKIDVKVELGHLFSKKHKNLLILVSSNLYTKINIYTVEAIGFKQLIDETLMTQSFPVYSIKDVNNDGLKDFLVNWYPESGCCRRNIFDIFLSAANKTFSKKIQLVNPTFFLKENVIRGVTYDHPGLASLYKFKWNGLKLDTLEYISPDIKDTLKISFVRSNRNSYPHPKNDQSENLKAIPKEYHTVLDLDYFKSYSLKDIKAISKNIDK